MSSNPTNKMTRNSQSRSRQPHHTIYTIHDTLAQKHLTFTHLYNQSPSRCIRCMSRLKTLHSASRAGCGPHDHRYPKCPPGIRPFEGPSPTSSNIIQLYREPNYI